jgi:hypothetical protein
MGLSVQGLTEEGRRTVEAIAARHGVGSEAVTLLLTAIAAGGGRQAQFNHPDLGGMGQWSQGGMIMVGDMFNQGLKYRIDALCNELAAVLANASPFAPTTSQHQSQSNGGGVSLFVPGVTGTMWPAELGAPASTGAQNDLHYAVFPGTRRLAISRAGRMTVYHTEDHLIGGVSQQQSGDQSLTFTSQHGLVRLADLKIVSSEPEPESSAAAVPQAPPADPGASPGPFAPPATHHQVPSAPPAVERPLPPADPVSATSDDDIFYKLERLAELRAKDIITAAEFDAKKAELLARL